MPKKIIDKREYWLDDDAGFSLVIERGYATFGSKVSISTDGNTSIAALKKLWQLLELVAEDEWRVKEA